MDTGSTYTWISAARLRGLEVQPTERRRVPTIEGKTVDRPAGEILITLEGRTLHTLCLFGESGDLEALGAYTLEGFGLAVEPGPAAAHPGHLVRGLDMRPKVCQYLAP